MLRGDPHPAGGIAATGTDTIAVFTPLFVMTIVAIALIGGIFGIAAYMLKDKAPPLADRIDAILPQTSDIEAAVRDLMAF